MFWDCCLILYSFICYSNKGGGHLFLHIYVDRWIMVRPIMYSGEASQTCGHANANLNHYVIHFFRN